MRGKGRPRSPLDDAKVIELAGHMGIRKIATLFHVHPDRIREIMEKYNCPRLVNGPKPKPKPAALPTEPRRAISWKKIADTKSLIQQGVNDFEIAYRVGGVSSDWVREIRRGVAA